MKHILCIFVLWIGWSSYQLIRGKSVAPSISFLTDITKKTDDMTKRKTILEVKTDFNKMWKDEYDYSLLVEYKNNKQKIPIICHKHGIFFMSANDHLRGHGCPKCADEKTGERCRMTYEEFIRCAKEVHGDFYGYSKITKENFIDSHHDVVITCPIHGDFEQSPNEHLGGKGCYWCGKKRMAEKQALKLEDVIERLNIIHHFKYDYSEFTEYHSKDDRITVICPTHGKWEVSVNNHLYQQSGCPHCKRSLGEEKVAEFLSKNNITFKEQYRINNESILCSNTRIFVDFYVPEQNVFIEYNGIQHYKENPMFSTRSLSEQKERDFAVSLYCKQHKIKLIEIPYTEFDNIDEILSKELKVKKNYGQNQRIL